MGRTKGSKDGPRPPGAPPRGRPRKDASGKKKKSKRRKAPSSTPSPTPGPSAPPPSPKLGTGTITDLSNEEFEDLFDLNFTEQDFHGLDAFERAAFGEEHHDASEGPDHTQDHLTGQSTDGPTPQHSNSGTDTNAPEERDSAKAARSRLDAAARATQTQRFFTPKATFSDELDSDSEVDDDDDSQTTPAKPLSSKATEAKKAWFRKPVRMQAWLYQFFGETIRPLISQRTPGRHLERPPMFKDQPYSLATMWVRPSDAVFALAQRNFDPKQLWRPDILLWLPHFLVPAGTVLACPTSGCGKALEKNGPTPPRLVAGMDRHYYIVSWQYYCRDGCKKYYCGWSRPLLESLPSKVRIAFPAELSHRSGLANEVITTLRVCNQHKMGPAGVRALMVELSSLRFNRLQNQYLEALLEVVWGQNSMAEKKTTQTSILSYVATLASDFGTFWDSERYGGFVPSEKYLTSMMNRIIERDEAAANQHTSLLCPDQLAMDDSHKAPGHVCKSEGVPNFTALWTCMDSRYIRGQALTSTKSHEERLGPLQGIANTMRSFGYPDPPIAFSDDPKKDQNFICRVFPSLGETLTPMAAAYGLKELALPSSVQTLVLESPETIEASLAPLLHPLDINPKSTLVIGFDAEWNISRSVGVSIIQLAPESQPDCIYIIPVHKLSAHNLPPSLVRILVSKDVYKVGSAIKGDFTRLKRQFPQLSKGALSLVDLKEYCITQGVIERSRSGSLDTLVEKTLHQYLPKDDSSRKCEDWERHPLRQELIKYAALDAYASRLVYEEARKREPKERVTVDTPPGTRVTLYTHSGSQPAAHGTVSSEQPSKLNGVRVRGPKSSSARLVLDIDTIIIPSAPAALHLIPGGRGSRNKAGTYTLNQLQSANRINQDSGVFRMVAHLGDVRLYDESQVQSPQTQANPPAHRTVADDGTMPHSETRSPDARLGDEEELDEEELGQLCGVSLDGDFEESDAEEGLAMLQAYSEVAPEANIPASTQKNAGPIPESIRRLEEIIQSPPDAHATYTRIKKDIFHAIHAIPLSRVHGSTIPFVRTIRDHVLRWEPRSRERVDRVCRKEFNLTFDEMLVRNPRWVAERTPRHVPSPSVLVLALEHIFKMFEDARDAKTGDVLFTPAVREKANSLLELARQGYLSDLDGVAMYERAGVDKFGLQKWRCLRGTNNVEGGPHGDIYRKFGALNAGPEFMVNCLTDHRTWYNLQAWATHLFGVDWEYHHDIAMINRTAFLLGYLSDVIDGAKAYDDWIIGDLYQQTSEQFGICTFPDTLRERYCMEAWTDQTRARFPLPKNSNNWLRKRQGLALPVLPPTTLDARKYFFSHLRSFTPDATTPSNKKRVNFEAFSQEWNRTADGKVRFYITPEVLAAYAKRWEKASNIQASQDLIYAQITAAKDSARVFAASNQPFPSYLLTNATQPQPSRGAIDLGQLTLVPPVLDVYPHGDLSQQQAHIVPPPHFPDAHLPTAHPVQLNSVESASQGTPSAQGPGMSPMPYPGPGAYGFAAHSCPGPFEATTWAPATAMPPQPDPYAMSALSSERPAKRRRFAHVCG